MNSPTTPTLDRQRIAVTFEPIGPDGPGTLQRLQLALKAASRTYGLRAVDIRPAPTQPESTLPGATHP